MLYWCYFDIVDMFECLEEKKDSLSITSYGIAMTTLEEVFLKLGKLSFNIFYHPV